MAARRLLRLAEVAGGAYILYRGYKVLSQLAQSQHDELVGHSAHKSRPAPTGFLRDRYFQNAQGLWLFKRQWRPAGDPVGSVFLVHGYGEVSQRFAPTSGRSCALLRPLHWARDALLFCAPVPRQHCGRYEHVAKALTTKGFVVFALDHQGTSPV